MAVTPDVLAVPRPRWPSAALDPASMRVRYGAYADELVVSFDDRPVASFSDPIDAPEGSDTAILVGMDADGRSTDEVVGIHVFPLLEGPAKHRPAWRRLAEPDPPTELVARFVAEVRDLFERYWTPPPPPEERLAGQRLAQPEG